MPALDGAFGHQPGVGAGQTAALLHHLEVAALAEALLHGPPRALLEHAPEVLLRQSQVAPAAANAGRHAVEHRRDDVAEPGQHVRSAQT